ncbi:MAG: hypothetical protein ING75_01715 [Rhodocyclaceae bacterium]|nr:hypothetical protein [Rhodocyclaceae bacterium]
MHHWPYAYVRTEIRLFERFAVERFAVATSVTDVASGKIAWTARTRTDGDSMVEREAKALVHIIMRELERSGML